MATARLTALRLTGFKSFAEKTIVEFGPGISAVVGPNGSGKSNLADALRWTLGEQGRSLRTRRSEDVIFAGSSSRRAIGMADVTLVVDNGDRLLPVDYGEVEIGRRLYRSGESEYLLNRQRIRLRDLVELLDSGNLADNAFLFIGQGMVDQALALRPEERRPLFEEAAGVRRHERRRRQAEQELIEAESNLDRLRDVLAELRPQAKRLAAQAEQLQARRTAGVELAEGLLAAARARWLTASDTAAQQQKSVDRARAAADTALVTLKTAEDESAALTLAIGKRADSERAQRDALDAQRASLTELRVNAARLDSELASVTRDSERLTAERLAVEQRIADAGRALSAAQPAAATNMDEELALVERQLEQMEPAQASVDVAAQLRARRAELDQQSRRRDSTAASLEGAKARHAELATRLSRAQAERDDAVAAARKTDEDASAAESALGQARQAADVRGAARAAALERVAETESELAQARARMSALDALLSGADDGLARAARARGAKLLGEGLEVDPKFRVAVSAALGAAASAYLVNDDAVTALAGRRGTLALPAARGKWAANAADAALAAVREVGGGALTEAVRRDPQSQVTRLLERALWTPDIDSALGARKLLPAGWRIVTLAGEVIADDGIVTLASGDSVLDRRAERDVLAREVTDLESRLVKERATLDKARKDADEAANAARQAAQTNDALRYERRRAEEAERVAQRRAEQMLRERDWEHAQVERLTGDLAVVEGLVAQISSDIARLEEAATAHAGSAAQAAAAAKRREELRARRDELRRERDRQLGLARAAEDTRRTAEIRRNLDETRLVELDAQIVALADRSLDMTRRREELAAQVAAADAAAKAASASLAELLSAGADERARLVAAERAAVDARERLRQAELTSRQAEMTAMEARMQLEQTREQLLVELATIGNDGLIVLRAAAGLTVVEQDEQADDNAAETMEELLGVVVDAWRAQPGAEENAPSQGRLASLRRRFNELGAGNPYAVEEYAELHDRLASLDSQRADMETAISNTRELIASLSALINEQFRTTFAALEDAFERRFHELFGGGDAQLSLTQPEDISATGIEIHARPPGKKRQPLSMLSGGERALTAVSLLLAMLEVRPVPFCVLDEVDAALDEANVGRFAKALRGLSDQTQFIVITHNRGTIEGADALYGVTIGDDAVSRVVSMRLPRVAKNGHSPEIDDELTEAALA